MGKPESQEEHHAVGRAYLPIYEEQELLMARTIMGSTKVVFISRYVENIWRRIFATRGFPFPMDDRFRVIHHGLDLKHFSPSPRSSRSIFVLGSVGALRERFRLTSLLSVSRILDFEHRLLIVGSMTVECQKVYEEAMRDPEISRRIQYIPWVNAETLPDYYRKMDCLFHPVDYEGLGIVVTEALACGVPVVVPAHGAPKEYVSEDAGIAVETKQFQYDDEFSRNMAEAVYKIRDHQVEYSKGARLQAEKVLSIKNKVDDYLDFMRLPRYIKTGM
jgi:glycosyltransferase involved in cell wall biosynthesis